MIDREKIFFFLYNVANLPIKKKINLNFNDFQKLIFPKNDYEIIDVYGKGEYGLVLKVRSTISGDIRATKVASFSENSQNEFLIQKVFADYDMAPKLYSYEVIDTNIKDNKIQFLKAVMDPIYTTLSTYLKTHKNTEVLFEPFSCLIKKKYILKYPFPFLHSDMHINNIIILKDKKTLGFIDFGMSDSKFAYLQILDCIPLIASLKFSAPQQGVKLCKYLIDLYEDMFKIQLFLKNFVIHPGGGCAYYDKGIYLHSYDWKPNKKRNPFPTLEEIKKVFPTFKPPIVK